MSPHDSNAIADFVISTEIPVSTSLFTPRSIRSIPVTMSGFEIAGVVLGSLPVLFNSALVVQKGLQNTIDWIRFNRKFEDFVTRVEIEEISYRQVLKLLLDKTPIPQHEFNVLISNSRSDLWKDAYIIKAIESRFDEAEKAFVRRQLASLSYAVQGLQDLLPSNLVRSNRYFQLVSHEC